MRLSSKERSGDEHYTPVDVVIKFLLPFAHNHRVYTPFGNDSNVRCVLGKYTTVIDTPHKFNGDFFKAMEDENFISFLKRNKFVVVDNPPFSKAAKIIRFLEKSKLDYFLFGSTLTALTLSKGKIMYLVLGPIKYESDKLVHTCLFSNTFNSIRRFPLLQEGKPLARKKNRGYITSGDIDTLTKKGLVIRRENILGYTGSLFGGAILYRA